MKIVVTRPLPPGAQQRLQQYNQVFQWTEQTAIPRERLLQELKDADGLLCMITDRIDQELIDAAPHLKVVSTCSVGVDHIDLEACRSIKVGNTPGVLTRACADLAITLIMVYSRRIREALQSMEDNFQKTFSPTLLCGWELNGKTVGIIGRGRIGLELCHRLLSFGVVRLVYSTSGQSNDVDLQDYKELHRQQEDERLLNIGMHYSLQSVQQVALQELLKQSDVVVVSCSLNESTKNLINRETLNHMKKSALLVNIARGPIVNTLDLVDALQTGTIQGAALDVTDPEPLPKDHPLLNISRNQPYKVVLLPHISSATMETREAMANLSLDNLIAGLEGSELPNEVKAT